MTKPDTLLSVRNLSIDFHLRTHVLHAVRNVSFDLKRGQTMALVGESGSGKSVTARALMRIIDKPGRMIGGQILLDGPNGPVDVARFKEGSREVLAIRGGRIGLIFQEPMSSLSPVHTIGSQIVEAVRLHRRVSKSEARARCVELLRQVEIPQPELMADRYTFEFSGGMRQRAMIAMALACDPQVLIADEPTTALDVTTQAEILDLIKRLQDARGMAMLLITHDMGIVAEVADDVAVMRFGKIVEQGPVDDIFHASQHPYTRQLLDATVKLESGAAIRALPASLTPSVEPVLSVRNLTKIYGAPSRMFARSGGRGLVAVDDASLDLFPGENLGIVGESGSGKTTLGRMILRIVEPTSGTVTYRADATSAPVDVTALGKVDLRRYHQDVRLIFQDPFASLNPRMTVKQIIGDPLVISKGMSGKAVEVRVAELMGKVGLDPLAMERYPHAFSGGQRQRIGIARALALNPTVIVADEATSALDVSIRSQILDLMIDIQKQLHLSFIFISHDISVVRYFCDRVAVMHRGKIVEVGDAETICTNPSQPYTRRLISSVPNPDPRNKRMLHRLRTDQV
ncbi:dipeptide ABC transporter ATP-binding protein [Sinorhizobium medicae]|uniref:Dipeptide ABC transporter ATP-binding protein n=2 Tax=Sinorhizobium medicae TaxID=110321 RepID=A0A6G1WRT4_9HYPH|nr:ABC transporter ATP-binding protein [Sinorhizobium medicae]ABR64307.1 ABC transporter related [Sinorhizobium medicae WSM419]MDX0425073.1 dipeptide ABC transporter ATP-binding protein [Sinorhizobium medicae]MDX0437909.1 dipeptide ABC transporter ATP-binding protein [Sinorhizobium medicae]MDX0444426.1 dipeptide ABC transporter ATP-binding protein [Sinorhizobium medicae]MDX0455991.1 dipeptide ABC transporter ATP-binding protein [Sinorhizobium medicae]